MKKTTPNIKPEVSVIMAACNAEKFISKSIESILSQSFKNLELIIIDDGSTDSTLKILKQFAEKDSRVRVFSPGKIGIIEARNKAIKESVGDFIAIQDADDISYSNRIESQLNYLKKNKEVGVLGGWLDFFNDGSEDIIISVRKYKEHDKKLRRTVFKFSPIAQPVCMIRKKVLDELGSYNKDFYRLMNFDNDKGFPEDLELWFRIGTKYKFANIQKPLLKYRISENSATFKGLRKMEIATIRIRRHYSGHQSYHFSFFDFLYNISQYASIYIIPSKTKIAIFNFFRNSKGHS